MAVSARFEADFSQFVASTKNAEAALGKVAQGSARVGSSFTVLQGGAGGAAGKIDKFNLSVGQGSALLGRFGLDIPPAARGLADIASLSAKADGALSLLGKASLVVGTALASWEVGKWIGEVSGWTDAVADATAKAMGWGDVAGQEAAAGQDVLARATKTAGREITNQVEAMRINQEEAERLIAKNQKLGDSFLKVAADAAEASRVYENNRTKLQKLEHDLAVAQETRKANDKAAYAEMQTETTKDLKDQQLNTLNFLEMETQFELERLRNLQELDIQNNARQMQLRADAKAAALGAPFAMATPESYGGFTLPSGGTPVSAAPMPAPVVASRGYSPPRGSGGSLGTTDVYISGLSTTATQQLAQSVSSATARPSLTSRRW